jgi:hypothetical protein
MSHVRPFVVPNALQIALLIQSFNRPFTSLRADEA